MTKLEHIYLMNVVLYFTQEEQVLKFLEINKKCQSAVESMKINPFIKNASFKRIKKLFKGIETYQLVYSDDNEEIFDGISIIEYNNENNEDLYAHYPNTIESHAHKIRKLHSVQYNKDFERVAKNFTILRSLKVVTPWDYDNNQSIQPLFALKDVVTLKELIIYISELVNIDDFTKLRKLLRNVKITLIIITHPYDEEINNEYIDAIARIQGINVYINQFNEHLNSKYVIPLDYFEYDTMSVIKNKEYYNNIFSLCCPTKLYLLHDDYFSLDEISDEISEKSDEHEDIDDTINELNFDDYLMLTDLSITFPNNPIIHLHLPTTLTTLTITSNRNKGLQYDSFHDIPLTFFDLYNEKNKNISLPSTLTYLCIESCSNCTFTFKEQWSLKEIIITSCSNCTIPICDTYKYFDIIDIGKNKYIKYGQVNNIEHFFQGELFTNIAFNEYSIEIEMNENVFIDELDLSIFKVKDIQLININTNKVVIDTCTKLDLMNGSVKEINFNTCNKLICSYTSSIDIIKGGNIDYLEFISNSKPQFIINNIDYYLTNTCYIPSIPIKTLHFREIKEELIDLKTCIMTNIIISFSDIQKLIVPSTLTSFENNKSHLKLIEGLETSNISNEQKKRLIIKYCNGNLPEVSGKQLTIKSEDWKIIDARAIKVNYLAIVNCSQLTDIQIPNTLKTLVLNQCDGIEVLNLTTSQLYAVNIKNCKSIKTLLVNDNVKKIINSCPLLK
ncbi:LRR containing protein [Entamoeba marina]